MKKRKRGRPKATKSRNKTMNKLQFKCSKCKRVVDINTHNLELYTTKVKKDYICVFCR